MNTKPFRPQPAVNSTVLIAVFLLFGFGPLLAAVLLASRSLRGSWQAAVAPFASALVAVLWILGLRLLERKMARGAAAWPPVLLGIPVGGAVAGLAAAAVDPAHHWLLNTITGAFWGGVAAALGWWRHSTSSRAIKGPAL